MERAGAKEMAGSGAEGERFCPFSLERTVFCVIFAASNNYFKFD